MKQLLCSLLWLSLISTAPVYAQAMTEAERDIALDLLTGSRKALEAEVRELSNSQLNYQPQRGGWSVAQIVEHLALTEKGIQFLVREKMLKDLPNAEQAPAVTLTALDISSKVSAAERPVKSAEAVTPTGQLGDGRASLKAFIEGRKASIDYVKKTTDRLHDYTSESPLGRLDGVQWFAFLAGHTLRHVQQIKRVKAEPNFPKVVAPKETWTPYGG